MIGFKYWITMKKNGIFIVFEGVEKCGKKTQSQLLKGVLDQINEEETLFIQFPDKSTTVGKIIEQYVKGELILNPKAAHLLYTANRLDIYYFNSF